MKQRSWRLKRLLHSYLKFDKVSCVIKAKKSAKKCAARSGFKVLVSNPQVALPFKTILDTFVEKWTILLKTLDETEVRRYPHTQRLNMIVRRSRRFALRTFQNSSLPSSLYVRLSKKRNMFSISLENFYVHLKKGPDFVLP